LPLRRRAAQGRQNLRSHPHHQDRTRNQHEAVQYRSASRKEGSSYPPLKGGRTATSSFSLMTVDNGATALLTANFTAGAFTASANASFSFDKSLIMVSRRTPSPTAMSRSRPMKSAKRP